MYRAWDTRLDREVALKILRRHAAEGASPGVEEGRLLARVRHPNAVTVHGADCINGRAGIWMEFINGRTLEQELDARGPLPAADVVALGIDVCRALEAVHGAGVLHRDVKAQNVMRDVNGRIVLMDFGSGLSEKSEDVAVGGTPLYLAPEVLEGNAATVRSDIYAAGVLLYHLLTGRYPVDGTTLADVRARHGSGATVPLRALRPDLPKAVGAAIERALTPDPSQRHGSAAAFQADLARAVAPGIGKPGAAAALAGLLVLTATLAWDHQRQSTERVAFHAREWVLVTAFDNLTGDAVPDGAIEHVFERELSNSPFVNVVPRDRIDDALGLMAKPRETQIDQTVGREIALRDGAIRAIVVGRIQKVGSRFELTAQVVNPLDGAALASVSEGAGNETQLLTAIRRGATAVRIALGEALTVAQNEASLEKVTTPSLRAAQLYTQADRAFAAGGRDGVGVAARLLEEATRSDPAFPSAHFLLARAYFNLHEKPRATAHFQRAYDLSGTTSERERLFIVAGYHDYVLEQPERAAETYEALLQLYPDHYGAITELSSVYFRLQRNDDRNRLVVRLADLRPANVRANWSAVTALSSLPGGFARAQPYYERCTALVAQRTDGVSPELIEDIRLFPASQHWHEGDVPAAYAALVDAEREGVRPNLKTAYLHMTFGELAEAERQLSQAMPPEEGRIHLALLALFRGDLSDAQKRLSDAAMLPTQMLGPAAAALIRLGRPAEAQRVYRELSRRLAASTNPFFAWTMDKQIVEGLLALAAGRTREGSSQLEAVLPGRPFASPVVFLAWQSLADTYRRIGRNDDARRVLRAAAAGAVSPNNPSAAFSSRLRVELASLEREAGQTAEAARIESTVRRQLTYADADHPLHGLLSLR